jgi:FkbM family methyltransferase
VDIDYKSHVIDGREVWFAISQAATDPYSQALRAAPIPQPAVEHVRRRHAAEGRPVRLADIGANVGTVALPAAICHGATVLAVEALAGNHALLVAATLRNGVAGRVTPVHMAAFGEIGVVPIAGHSAWGVTGPRIVDGAPTSAAPIADILDLHAFRPDLVKIDIEGAELAGLTGVERLCDANPGLEFVVEVNSLTCSEWGYTGQDLCRRFERLGLSLFAWMDAGVLAPVSSHEPHRDVWFDILATRSSVGRLRGELGYRVDELRQLDVLDAFEVLARGDPHMRSHVVMNAAHFPEAIRNSERVRAMLEVASHGRKESAAGLATQPA